jgi:hypothetical protein
MLVQSLSCSPLNSASHTLLATSVAALAFLRRPFGVPFRGALRRGCVAAGVAAGTVAVTSLLCLALALPVKMIIPSDLLGGIHPASMDMLLSSTPHSLRSMR